MIYALLHVSGVLSMALDTYVDVFLTSKNGDIYLFLKARIFFIS